MTMPHERSRAIVQTQEFLEQLSRDASQSEDVRKSAIHLLRHYPSKIEVLMQGRIQEGLAAKYGYQPFLCSKLD
ncbi:BPSL0761 family protein [Pseudomonas sp.]|uniref:BPSL0761 family protein n=1 Tax=Pseudomonas sp. TaxID=306 RepID=UPI003C78CCF6